MIAYNSVLHLCKCAVANIGGRMEFSYKANISSADVAMLEANAGLDCPVELTQFLQETGDEFSVWLEFPDGMYSPFKINSLAEMRASYNNDALISKDKLAYHKESFRYTSVQLHIQRMHAWMPIIADSEGSVVIDCTSGEVYYRDLLWDLDPEEDWIVSLASSFRSFFCAWARFAFSPPKGGFRRSFEWSSEFFPITLPENPCERSH